MDVAIVNLIVVSPNIRPRLLFESPSVVPVTALEEVNIIQFGRALSNLGHCVTIYVADAFLDEAEVELGHRLTVRSVRTRLHIPFHPAVLPLAPTLTEPGLLDHVDVVQSGEYHHPSTLLVAQSARRAGIPSIVWQETFQRMRQPGAYYQRLYEASFGRRVERLTNRFVPRTVKARQFLRDLGVPDDRIGPWIPTGVDTDFFRPGDGTSGAKPEAWPTDCHVLGIVGRLGADKGIDIAIQALRILRRRGLSVGLLIRGSGPEQAALERLARDLDVADRIRFVPQLPREELRRFYNSLDLVLLTSRIDLLPFALLEAASCARASVVTAVGAVEDIVKDGVTGRVVPPGSPERLADAVAPLLQDPERRRSMGLAARRWMESTFAFPRVAMAMSDVYERAASGTSLEVAPQGMQS